MVIPPGEVPAGAEPIPGDYDDEYDGGGDGDDDGNDGDGDLQIKFISVCQHSVVVVQVPFELLPSSGCSFMLWKVDNDITGNRAHR